MSNDPNASASAPTWENWSGNLVHKPAADGVKYFFMPTSLTELRSVLAEVAKGGSVAKSSSATAGLEGKGATIRVSGQRHSQPPLVADDNRGSVPQTTTVYLVDMSCYADLGSGQDQRLVLGPGNNQVTVNAGVSEDELDAFLTQNNLMMKTVTAGGFFSVGGMTAVDVHGGTVNAPIFAETVSAFNILLADGTVTTIDAQSPAVSGWSPLQFARVSLGGLGIVTSVTIDVLSRPYATTLQGSTKRFGFKNKSAFVNKFQPLLSSHSRLETFFTPYATSWVPLGFNNFLALWWDVVDDPTPKTPNQPPQPYPKSACTLASQAPPEYGAPDLGFGESIAEAAAIRAQSLSSAINPLGGAAEIAITAFDVIEGQVATANKSHAELWLTKSARVIFMSYYVPLPDLKAAGLGKVWDGLDVVARIVTQDGNFHMAAPMEFRFVKGGNSAMSGAYSDDPNAWFVNLDLIGFVDTSQKAVDYPPQLLKFFADVEREWVKMGGFPHNGKIYGFYDPTEAPGTYSKTGPFNPNFLADLRTRRGARLENFKAYRESLDPNGLFVNDYLRQVLGP